MLDLATPGLGWTLVAIWLLSIGLAGVALVSIIVM